MLRFVSARVAAALSPGPSSRSWPAASPLSTFSAAAKLSALPTFSSRATRAASGGSTEQGLPCHRSGLGLGPCSPRGELGLGWKRVPGARDSCPSLLRRIFSGAGAARTFQAARTGSLDSRRAALGQVQAAPRGSTEPGSGGPAQQTPDSLSLEEAGEGRGGPSLPVHQWHSTGGAVSWDSAVPALRGKGVPVVHHELYSAPQLPPGHRFPMPVFQVIHDTLIQDGIVDSWQVINPPALPRREDVLLAHDDSYLRRFETGTLDPMAMRRIGFPWSPSLVERTLSEVSGTLRTAELALAYGVACNTAGGTHHAFRDFGSGFCILNDIAVAALALLERGAVQRIAIVDLDVHQGDGTAAILANEPRAFTFSMHCGANFPARKQAEE